MILLRRVIRVGPAVVLLCAVASLSLSAGAQDVSRAAQASLQPEFDVVSIRPMKSDDNVRTHITNSARGGYIKAVNVTLKALLEVAYDIPELRMYGGPDWVTSEKFSLEAKADPKLDEQFAGLSPEQGRETKRRMLAALLADRFKLKVHTEAREMPVYALVVAKGGARLSGASASEADLTAGAERIVVRAGGDSLAVLAYELSWRLGRPVIDRTGLPCREAFKLEWQEAASADATGPSLFTAIQEQLGLKLEPARGLVPVLVIDHAEKPVEN